MLERVSLGGSDTSIINQLIDFLISLGWTDRGTQTKSINFGGTNYNITARGCANANGWVLWGITGGWPFSSRIPLFFSHLNTTNNFMNDGHQNDRINIRAVGCCIPEIAGSSSRLVRVYANNTNFILASIQAVESTPFSGSSAEYYYLLSRTLIFLNWTQSGKEYVVMSNDIFINLFPFNTITNIITAVKQGGNVNYYYNEEKTKDNATRREYLPTTLFNTGMYVSIGFNGTENSLDISPIKVKIGNDIVDLPDEVVFVSSHDEIAPGTRLTTPPYDLYKTMGNTKYYIGVKYV